MNPKQRNLSCSLINADVKLPGWKNLCRFLSKRRVVLPMSTWGRGRTRTESAGDKVERREKDGNRLASKETVHNHHTSQTLFSSGESSG